MPRYEYKDAKSSKFWEIRLEGDTYTVRFGRIGADGTVQNKVFADAAKAQKEYDKVVKKKVKKGYALVADSPSAGDAGGDTPSSARAELEAAIHANPTSREAWQVYADWAQTQGDPRGELILLHHAIEDGASNADELKKRSDEIFAEHRDEWAGKDLAKLIEQVEEEDDSYGEDRFLLEWWCGYIMRAKVGMNDQSEAPDTPAQARIVLSSPASRFIRRLDIGLDVGVQDGEAGFAKSVLSVARLGKNMSLRHVHVGRFEIQDEYEISWTSVGDVGRLYPVLPNLEYLRVTGGSIDLGTVNHAKLKRLQIETGGLPAAAARSLSRANLPELEELEVWFGTDEYGGTCSVGDIAGLLSGDRFPKLKKLGLKNAEIQNDIVRAVVTSQLVARVEELDLSMGIMTDEGAQVLIDNKDKLAHLKRLDVSENALDESTAALLATFGDRIVLGEQEPPDEYGAYVSIGE